MERVYGCTTIVPVMDGWIEQWYGYVPARVKVNGNDAPFPIGGEINATGAPVSDTTVCEVPSLFVQVTVVPAFTVRVAGLNAKFLIATAFAAAAGAGVVAAGTVEPE
jgi:hypothetical protein